MFFFLCALGVGLFGFGAEFVRAGVVVGRCGPVDNAAFGFFVGGFGEVVAYVAFGVVPCFSAFFAPLLEAVLAFLGCFEFSGVVVLEALVVESGVGAWAASVFDVVVPFGDVVGELRAGLALEHRSVLVANFARVHDDFAYGDAVGGGGVSDLVGGGFGDFVPDAAFAACLVDRAVWAASDVGYFGSGYGCDGVF